MPFVRSAEEIAAIEAALSRPRYFDAARLSVEFETDPEILASLLPPPLRPGPTPLVAVTIGRWRSNCLGRFDGALVHLSVVHEGLAGTYALVMYMSGEAAIGFGREAVGEPKRYGRGWLFAGEEGFSAHLERRGTRLIELDMRPRESSGPGQSTNLTYNVKSRTAASGHGLEEDAILTRTTFSNSLRVLREGPASIRLRSTAVDPLGELPVVSVVRGVYAEYDAEARCESVATIPAAEYAPFHYGRVELEPG